MSDYQTIHELRESLGKEGIHLSELDGATHIEDVHHLEYRPTTPLITFEAFSKLPNLTSLRLKPGTIDFSQIDQLSNLTTLCCSIPLGADFSAIGKLKNLRELDINFAKDDKTVDVSPLAKLTGLTKLRIGNNRSNHTLDITKLSELVTLADLTLDISIAGVGALENFTNLKSLTLSHCKDLSGLSKLSHCLTSLNIGWEEDLVGSNELGTLSKLTHLYCKILKEADISPIGELTSLIDLHVYAPEVKDISAIGKLKQLEKLNLECCNEAENLDASVRMNKLKEFTINYLINLSSLSFLEGVQTLESVKIMNSSKKLKDISILSSCYNLKYLQYDTDYKADAVMLSIAAHNKDTEMIMKYSKRNGIDNVNGSFHPPQRKWIALALAQAISSLPREAPERVAYFTNLIDSLCSPRIKMKVKDIGAILPYLFQYQEADYKHWFKQIVSNPQEDYLIAVLNIFSKEDYGDWTEDFIDESVNNNEALSKKALKAAIKFYTARGSKDKAGSLQVL